MASSTRKKTPCSKCNKAAGILTCQGCGKDFCYRHVAEHRQELNKQLDQLTINHDQLQQTIADQEAEPNCHPLMEKIDTWEQESINKIHQAAHNARQELVTILGIHRKKVVNDLKQLTQELNRGRTEDDYVETDLKEWLEKLNKLKKDLTAAQTIDFGHDDNDSTLISKIFVHGVSTDIFERTINDIQIIEGGWVAVHGQTQQYGSACGRGEYSTGQHQFRFIMEHCNYNGYFSCGILSKTASIEVLQNVSKSHNLYYGRNNSGTFLSNNNNGLVYFTDLDGNTQKGDMVELFVDCDQRRIRLTNKGTNQRQDINVNLTACPFPWQFFITLLYANDRVRLCEERVCLIADYDQTNWQGDSVGEGGEVVNFCPQSRSSRQEKLFKLTKRIN